MVWTLEAIAGFVTASILLVAGAVALWQVIAARRSTDTQLVVGLYERFYSPETMQIVRLIYQTPPEQVKDLPREQKDKVEMVLNWFDMIGHLLAKGIINEYLAMEAFGGSPVLRCWHQLGQHYIKDERERRGAYYCKGVEHFARCTVRYQIKHARRDQWIKFYRGPLREKDRVNLIEKELSEPELLSMWQLRIAKTKRRLRSIYNKELR
jgi:hypothetical protein